MDYGKEIVVSHSKKRCLWTFSRCASRGHRPRNKAEHATLCFWPPSLPAPLALYETRDFSQKELLLEGDWPSDKHAAVIAELRAGDYSDHLALNRHVL